MTTKDYKNQYKFVLALVKTGAAIMDSIYTYCVSHSKFYKTISASQKKILRETALELRKTNLNKTVKKYIGKYYGKKINKWTIGEFMYKGDGKHGAFFFKCKCECGNVKKINIKSIIRFSSKSCGCGSKESGIKRRKYGKLMDNTKVYRAWANMKTRCSNPNRKQWHNYGGRGIKVCKRWCGDNGFKNFLKDMGEPPSNKHSLDRFPNTNGNYQPSNCRWATHSEQILNKRVPVTTIKYNDVSLTIAEWSIKTGIPHSKIYYRYKNSFPLDMIFYKGNLKKNRK